MAVRPTRFYSSKQEKQVAKAIGGKQTANSGATAFSKGDVRTDDFLIECKTCVKPQKSFTVQKEWFTKNKEEALEHISLGDFGTFDSEFYLFGENDALVKAKAIDDRAGCANIIEVMASIFENRPKADLDLFFCFTVREETGLSGAKVAANEIRPHIAIVLESTAIGDIPTAAPSKKVADVGKGGALSVADRATIYDKQLIDLALRIGKEENIPVQLKRYVSGGNDAGHIHKSGSGVRCLALSVPTRYLHSPACVASLEDIRSCRRLLEAMLRRLGNDNI